MRLRRRSPAILLLPTLAASLAVDAAARSGSVQEVTPDTQHGSLRSKIAEGVLAARLEKGTKDAPVDGLDGKPHAGPFVYDSKDKKKYDAKVEDLSASSSKFSDEIDRAKNEGWEIPERVDSVMTDREGEVKGKGGRDGTEGGVSEKSKLRKDKEEEAGVKEEKRPEGPKGVLEHEGEKVLKLKDGKERASSEKSDKKTEKGIGGLEKPAGLPSKPHDMPHPKPGGSSEPTGKEPIPNEKAPASSHLIESPSTPDGVIQPFHSFVLSLTMILVSEIGDKTFLVAALMAMRHDRLLVFSAAFGALIVMTVLSAVLGHAVPTLIPERFTHFAAAILFLVFGTKMMREGLAMDPHEGVGEEMKEVEMELEEKEHDMARKNSRRRSSITPYALEAGRGRRSRSDSRLPALPRSPSSSPSRSPSPNATSLKGFLDGMGNLLGLLLSPAWVQTFVMTFLGEWGDRSQIATIAMAAGSDYWWVVLGALFGHAFCTGVAVVGGKAIAGRVSLRIVTLGGAVAFLVFGVIYLLEAMAHS